VIDLAEKIREFSIVFTLNIQGAETGRMFVFEMMRRLIGDSRLIG
jgi:hypothetical protein